MTDRLLRVTIYSETRTYTLLFQDGILKEVVPSLYVNSVICCLQLFRLHRIPVLYSC